MIRASSGLASVAFFQMVGMRDEVDFGIRFFVEDAGALVVEAEQRAGLGLVLEERLVSADDLSVFLQALRCNRERRRMICSRPVAGQKV